MNAKKSREKLNEIILEIEKILPLDQLDAISKALDQLGMSDMAAQKLVELASLDQPSEELAAVWLVGVLVALNVYKEELENTTKTIIH